MEMIKENTFRHVLDDDGVDPRVLRTRKLIVDGFHELLVEKDFQAISVRDITDRATINRATFYAHFVDKYALFDYVIARSFHELLRGRLTHRCGLSTENLRTLLLTVRDYLSGHLAHCTPDNQQNIHPYVIRQVHAQVHEFLVHWFKPIANDLDAAAALISWAVMGAGIHYSEDQTLEMDVEQMVTVLTQGLDGIGINLD
ncbi:MAG: TetR/AcrR family transcriptional regulator [Chloroflexi bacterium]|nr:TetR/AcrR family transcriptional regulator [Chloroflexota bacterium]